MRASWLFCIALAHAGLRLQQQLREDVSGWQPGVWVKCVALVRKSTLNQGGLWGEATGKSFLPNGTFSKPFEHDESHLGHKRFGLC